MELIKKIKSLKNIIILSLISGKLDKYTVSFVKKEKKR